MIRQDSITKLWYIYEWRGWYYPTARRESFATKQLAQDYIYALELGYV